METMIVWMEVTNHQSTVIPKEELALAIFSLVIMDTAYQEFIFVTVTMIAWTIRMKMIATNAVSRFFSPIFY